MNDFSADLNLALRMADAADGISLQRFRSQDLKVETKADSSPVTDADRAVELKLKQMLTDERPADAIIGEEFGNSGTSKRTWIIDPIDGTANFMRGVPVWGALIALAIDGKPTVGVVSAPALGRRWWAAPGVRAKTTDVDGTERAIRVSEVSDLRHASLSYNNLQMWDRANLLPQLIELSRLVWRTRAYGDFFSYMLLAEGSVDVVAEHDLKIYDIAALVPIVEQAGGKLTAIDGPLTDSTSSTLATNTRLHASATAAFAR